MNQNQKNISVMTELTTENRYNNSLDLLVCFLLLSFSVSSQCAGSEMKPRTEDRGCDSVLLGQSYHTPHGAVIDEYGAMVE
jgi:hypothetical protein